MLRALLPPPRAHARATAADGPVSSRVHLRLSAVADQVPLWLAAMLALGLTVLLGWALEPRLFPRRRRLS